MTINEEKENEKNDIIISRFFKTLTFKKILPLIKKILIEDNFKDNNKTLEIETILENVVNKIFEIDKSLKIALDDLLQVIIKNSSELSKSDKNIKTEDEKLIEIENLLQIALIKILPLIYQSFKIEKLLTISFKIAEEIDKFLETAFINILKIIYIKSIPLIDKNNNSIEIVDETSEIKNLIDTGKSLEFKKLLDIENSVEITFIKLLEITLKKIVPLIRTEKTDTVERPKIKEIIDEITEIHKIFL